MEHEDSIQELHTDHINELISIMQQEQNSKHFRIDGEYLSHHYIDYLKSRTDSFVITQEGGLEDGIKEHYHCYLVIKEEVTNLASTFIKRFPLNKGIKHSLKKCKTNDWTNLKYVVKSKNIIYTQHIEDDVLTRAMDESYEKPLKLDKKQKQGRYISAKQDFLRKIELKFMNKEYSRMDILDHCLRYYGETGPYEEQHVYRLYNYVIDGTKYDKLNRSELKSRIISKYNLEL